MERRGFLIVERTAGHITGPAALERHEIPYNLLYPGGIKDEVYCLFWNHVLFLLKIHLFGI